jgi:hypothetical protein
MFTHGGATWWRAGLDHQSATIRSSEFRNELRQHHPLHFHFPPMSSDTPPSVPLPRPSAGVALTRNKPPVWAIDASEPSVQTPLPAKCARHTREGETCCQELKGEDERQLIDPDIIRDV